MRSSLLSGMRGLRILLWYGQSPWRGADGFGHGVIPCSGGWGVIDEVVFTLAEAVSSLLIDGFNELKARGM